MLSNEAMDKPNRQESTFDFDLKDDATLLETRMMLDQKYFDNI